MKSSQKIIPLENFYKSPVKQISEDSKKEICSRFKTDINTLFKLPSSEKGISSEPSEEEILLPSTESIKKNDVTSKTTKKIKKSKANDVKLPEHKATDLKPHISTVQKLLPDSESSTNKGLAISSLAPTSVPRPARLFAPPFSPKAVNRGQNVP